MKNEDFLDLLNEIDEKYIESASKRLEELHQYKDPEFGKALKPQVIRLETPEKRHIPFRRTAFAAAAVMICAVTVGVFVKLNKPPTFSPNSGVTLSETSSISEPISSESTVSEPTSREPTSREPVSSEPTNSEPTSSEPESRVPVSSEPEFSDEIMRRVMSDGYNFTLEIIDGKQRSGDGLFLKKGDKKGIEIAFQCSPECEGRRFTIIFKQHISRKTFDSVGEEIATLTFTARNYTQTFYVPYNENELKEGDECIMFLHPEDRDYTSHASVKGYILP